MGTNEQIDALESRIGELDAEVDRLREQLRQAQLDSWEGRIDDLDVQVHLASMDARERIAPIVDSLRDRWLDARQQVGRSGDTASEVLDRLQDGFRQAMKDIRDALADTKTTAVG